MDQPIVEPPNNGRNGAIAAHLLALTLFLGIPFGNIIGPLCVWLMKRKAYTLVDYNGKEALNFQITMSILGIVFGLLIYLLIGIPLLILLMIFNVGCVIYAAMQTSNGNTFRYPLSFRFIR